jgi:predicted amidohydrolase
MKIATAQTRPIKGDIPANIENHKKLIHLALANEADAIIFPELSLTGYEPTLAKELATTRDDGRLNEFQTISDTNHIAIGIGLPLKNTPRPTISMVIFQPHRPRQTYSKEFIHADEEPFFIGGQNSSGVLGDHPNIALAICYEISIPQHAQRAYKNGAEIYIASVAKFVNGIDNSLNRLSEIASAYSIRA